MFRIIKELRPTWVVGENVDGIRSMELDNCLADLEAGGYSSRAFRIPAYGVEARHQRYRIFIVAHSEHDGCTPDQIAGGTGSRAPHRQTREIRAEQPAGSNSRQGRFEDMEYPHRSLWPQYRNISGVGWTREQIEGYTRGIWESEPGLGRMADGSSTGLDEIIRQHRCNVLGEAVVPHQVFPIVEIIARIERGEIT